MERSPSPSGHYRPGVVLRDAWYGVAHSAAVRRSRPLARTIDGTSIALWRDGTGAIRAVEDRCAHRRAPLLDGDPRADKSVPADAAGLRYRQLRAALAERQDAGDFSYRDAWRGPDPAAAILMDGRIPDPA
jgi:hypothetical protein